MTKREALMWLIASAAYEPTRVRVNNGRSLEIIDPTAGAVIVFSIFPDVQLEMDLGKEGENIPGTAPARGIYPHAGGPANGHAAA